MTNFTYCPECTAELELDKNNWPSCPDGHFTKYPTPVAATLSLVHNNGQYLALKRSHAPRKGYWDLPGGFVEPEETAADTLIREIKEETGLEVTISRFLGTYPSVYGESGEHTLATAYLFEADTRNVELSDENNEYDWFDIEKMPEMAFADCEQAIKDLRKLLVSK